MKIFISNKKLNIVDKNNRFIGFDYESQCCELYGAILTSKIDDIELIVKSESDRHAAQDALLNADISGYVFDPDFHLIKTFEYDFSNGNLAIFRILSLENEDRYIAIFNIHNGYYCHNFSFCKDTVVEFSGSL